MLELVRQWAFDQHVRVQLLERALVAHQPQRHMPGDPDADLVRVESTDRDHATGLAEAVPLAQVAVGWTTDCALRREDHSRQVAKVAHALAGVVEEAPQLDAVEAVGFSEWDPRPLEALGSARERVRAEAEAARRADRVADLGPGQRAFDLALDAERQVVV